MALDDRFGGDEWWLPLHPSNNPFSFRFQMSPLGKAIVRNALWFFEGLRYNAYLYFLTVIVLDSFSLCLRLVPAGTYKVEEMLQQGGWGCERGGYTGVFTPMWLMVARKPLK
jgi:sterol 24-C-methyltransferase